MLTRIGPQEEQACCQSTGCGNLERPDRCASEALVRIGDARFPRPFPWRLEYNCPVHENWNIVHTGMLIPQTRQIYVCSQNCLRGVIMTAGEMDCADRISSVMPTEREVVGGRLEKVTIEGTSDLIDRLQERPRAVELFLVCMHHLCGADERYILKELRRRFPDIDFMGCWMDPIMQKVSLTPEQKQRKSMMAVIPKRPVNRRSVSVFGDNLRLPQTSDLTRVLGRLGIHVRQVMDCRDYDAYLDMGDSFLYLTRSPLSVYGLRALAEKNERPYLYLPPVALDGQIKEALRSLLTAAGQSVEAMDEKLFAFLEQEKASARQAFAQARAVIGNTEVWLDYLACPRPLSMARRLLEEGFRVTRICLDSISLEEQADFEWLKAQAPDLLLQSTSQVEARQRARIAPDMQQGKPEECRILALGPKAAFFAGTPFFVNWIEYDGNWGYDGLRRLTSDMIDAFQRPKDLRDTVQRKGLGLPSLPGKEDGRINECAQPSSGVAVPDKGKGGNG